MRKRRTVFEGQIEKKLPNIHYVLNYGRQNGWDLTKYNLFLEGTTDVAYFSIANDFYCRTHSKLLLDDYFQVFAIGKGDDGGTTGLLDKYRLLQGVMCTYPPETTEDKVYIVCLFDDDESGRGAFRAMKTKFAPWRDIFLLCRDFPTDASSTNQAESLYKRGYEKNKRFYCETEDLLSRDLVNRFVSENPNAIQKPIETFEGAFHIDIKRDRKGDLVDFVRKNATIEDLQGLINVLKFFRQLFRLD